jgi:hypothetical protein
LLKWGLLSLLPEIILQLNREFVNTPHPSCLAKAFLNDPIEEMDINISTADDQNDFLLPDPSSL